jgi:hypothetical protein
MQTPLISNRRYKTFRSIRLNASDTSYSLFFPPVLPSAVVVFRRSPYIRTLFVPPLFHNFAKYPARP